MEAYICIYLKICKTMIFCLHIFLRKLQMLAITVLFSSHLVSFTNKKHMAVLLYSISCISIQYACVLNLQDKKMSRNDLFIFAEMMGSSSESKPREQMLYDHRPLELNKDDYQRVCRVPKKKVLYVCHRT